jgi:hypothetical protein
MEGPKGDFGSQLQGPIVRFVEDPLAPGKYIDMRHMLIVGFKYGTMVGFAIEVFQLVKFPKSAMDPQDFYSNSLGAQFNNVFGLQVKTAKDATVLLDLFLRSEFFRTKSAVVK